MKKLEHFYISPVGKNSVQRWTKSSLTTMSNWTRETVRTSTNLDGNFSSTHALKYNLIEILGSHGGADNACRLL